jgi:hypothetical protein
LREGIVSPIIRTQQGRADLRQSGQRIRTNI